LRRGCYRRRSHIRCIAKLDTLKLENEEQQAGVNILKKALEEPLRWIAQNAGFDGSVVVEKVKTGEGSFGFNAQTDKFEDLVAAGIIDPTKVVRTALQNAASVAGLLITTEACVAEKPKEKEAPPMPPGGGMGGGMGGMY
jgi:chaperonin GroEL